MIATKRCAVCKTIRPRVDFHKKSENRDGLDGRCRPCKNAQERVRRERSPEQFKAKARRRNRRVPNRQMGRAECLAYHAVRNAIKRGDLVRPTSCPDCGTTSSPIYAHHEDYGKPLDVRWMCARCHKRYHAGLVA